jgi:hypothetical protein
VDALIHCFVFAAGQITAQGLSVVGGDTTAIEPSVAVESPQGNAEVSISAMGGSTLELMDLNGPLGSFSFSSHSVELFELKRADVTKLSVRNLVLVDRAQLPLERSNGGLNLTFAVRRLRPRPITAPTSICSVLM